MTGNILEAIVLTCLAWGGFFVLCGSVLAYTLGEGIGYVGSGLVMVAAGWLIAHAVKATALKNRRAEPTDTARSPGTESGS